MILSMYVAMLAQLQTQSPSPLTGTQFTIGGLAAQQTVQSHVDGSNDRLTGLLLGIEGGLSSDRFALRVRYGQGRVNAKPGTNVAARDEVEGEALLGFRATPWLSLWAGPSARAYTTADGDQRWLIWSGRATARGTLIPGRMQSFIEVWGAVSGNVGNPALKAGGRGSNGGLEVRLGDASTLWGRLGYRIESVHADGLRETVESLTLSLLYGLPQ
ncbi:MAG TPA: hypothetical protein VL549_08025 [Gemmatimonadales bacterium]|jgi:hypothetical protein|nr:hypothetical protein [Gemmatimonadales bacterium]